MGKNRLIALALEQEPHARGLWYDRWLFSAIGEF
jgi:hypothetical protein